MREKTLVKVCGYNLYRENWEEVMIGISPIQPGRLTMAVFKALKEDVDVLLIGTGSSQKNGILEADWTLRFLMSNFFDIFKKFHIFRKIPLRFQLARGKIRYMARTETKSKNTKEEMMETVEFLKKGKFDRIFLISDINHIGRMNRDFAMALKKIRMFNSDIEVDTSFSYIPYKGRINIEIVE